MRNTRKRGWREREREGLWKGARNLKSIVTPKSHERQECTVDRRFSVFRHRKSDDFPGRVVVEELYDNNNNGVTL